MAAVTATAPPAPLLAPAPLPAELARRYDRVTHVASTVLWQGRSFTSVPGVVLHSVSAAGDLVSHWYRYGATATHWRCGRCAAHHAEPRPLG